MTVTPMPIPAPRRPVDRGVEEELVTTNLPLVGYLVSEMIGRVPAHVSRDELMSAGLAALAQAARGFDPERGVPFGRFASTRIRGALIDELRSHDWASRSVRSKARRRDAAIEELAGVLGRTPTAEEVAAHLGVAVGEVESVEEDVQRAVVLSLQGFADPSALDEVAPVGDDSPDERLLLNEKIGYLHDAIAVLPERLRTVVVRYFFEERPMAEIAVELGVTESRVSQMRAEALSLLRDGMNSALEPELVQPVGRPDGCATRRREAYFAAVASHSDFRTRLSARPVDMGSVALATITRSA
ncbi:MAG: sigma-70 family RNA polymerase sigma factor [Motilibacteraceae bacterium]